MCCLTYLFLLFVKVVNDDTDEEVQGEERSKDDEEHEVQVHHNVDLPDWLTVNLRVQKRTTFIRKSTTQIGTSLNSNTKKSSI